MREIKKYKLLLIIYELVKEKETLMSVNSQRNV